MAKVADVDLHKVAVTIRIENDKAETVRRLEINVSETQDIKLERDSGNVN
jgi:hypothetical protein